MNRWVSSVLSGEHANGSAMVHNVEGALGPWRDTAGNWWAGVESGMWQWDSGLVRVVDSVEAAFSRGVSATVNTATGLPFFQSAEQWVRGNEFGLTWYIKVQRWWHKWILFCTPKWDAFEVWAIRVEMPRFARRVMSNVVFYRIAYLRWLLALASLETIAWRSSSAFVLLVLSMLSATVVRSNMLALGVLKTAREAEQQAGGIRSAAVMLTPFFGKSAAEKSMEAAAEKGQKDKSQLAAAVATMALVWGIVSPSNTLRSVVVLILGHALVHARQQRTYPMPRKVSNYGGRILMGVRIQVTPMDIFRAEPKKGLLSSPGPPTAIPPTETPSHDSAAKKLASASTSASATSTSTVTSTSRPTPAKGAVRRSSADSVRTQLTPLSTDSRANSSSASAGAVSGTRLGARRQGPAPLSQEPPAPL
mmetsp:Transcript_57270/g.48376  ORF Transcript_57270/g.48376 Transcript_57270/m.48376 type:complete len:420 (+) Transcript_57270:1-1260(+)